MSIKQGYNDILKVPSRSPTTSFVPASSSSSNTLFIILEAKFLLKLRNFINFLFSVVGKRAKRDVVQGGRTLISDMTSVSSSEGSVEASWLQVGRKEFSVHRT